VVRLYGMVCGWLTGPARLFVAREPEDARLRVPVLAYLVVHPRGAVVFDSGMHLAVQSDPETRIGPLSRVFDVEFAPGQELSAQLERVEVAPTEVRWLVNSHLHFDHAGGNDQVPNAQLVIQAREWWAAHEPDLMERNGYALQDYDFGQDRLEIDGEHDLFGDGSVTCIPTYGHTAGHQSLRVRLDSGDVVLTGDACYLRRTLEELALPLLIHDRADMLASLERLRRLRDGGARLLFGHDAAQWPDSATAPGSATPGPAAPIQPAPVQPAPIPIECVSS